LTTCKSDHFFNQCAFAEVTECQRAGVAYDCKNESDTNIRLLKGQAPERCQMGNHEDFGHNDRKRDFPELIGLSIYQLIDLLDDLNGFRHGNPRSSRYAPLCATVSQCRAHGEGGREFQKK
jgi:hypothetical protein